MEETRVERALAKAEAIATVYDRLRNHFRSVVFADMEPEILRTAVWLVRQEADSELLNQIEAFAEVVIRGGKRMADIDTRIRELEEQGPIG